MKLEGQRWDGKRCVPWTQPVAPPKLQIPRSSVASRAAQSARHGPTRRYVFETADLRDARTLLNELGAMKEVRIIGVLAAE